jgi:hypothetical protein
MTPFLLAGGVNPAAELIHLVEQLVEAMHDFGRIGWGHVQTNAARVGYSAI